MPRAFKIAATALLLVVVGFSVRVEQRFSWEDFLPADSDGGSYDRQVRARFGEEARPFIFVALSKGETTWTPQSLGQISALIKAIEQRPWLAASHSPFGSEALLPEGEALAARVPLAPLPRSEAEAKAARDALQGAAMPGQRWVSRDGTALLLVLELAEAFYRDFNRAPEVYAELLQDLQPMEQAGFEIHLAGTPVVEARSALFLAREAGLFCGLTLLLMGIFLWLGLGSPRLAIVTIGVGLASVAVLGGLLGLLGIPFSLLSIAAPVVVLVVVVCDIIFISSDYLRRLDEGASPAQARDEAIRRGRRTCFWTSATSAAGFATFYLSSIPVIRDFALATALGILGGYAVTMLALPPLLLWVEARPPVAAALRRAALERLLALLATLLLRRRAWVAAAFVALALLAGLAAGLARVDSTVFEEIDADNAIVQDNRYFARQFTGEMNVSAVITLPPGASALDPEHFGLLRDIEERLSEAPDLVETVGVASLMGWAFEVFGGEAPPRTWSKSQLSQLGLMVDSFAPDLLQRFRHREETGRGAQEQLRIDLRFSDPAARQTLALLEKVKAELSAQHPDVGLAYSGRTYRAMQAFTGLTLEALTGLLVAAGVILLLMVLALRSLSAGIFSMLPNALPLLCALAAFGLLGVTLKPSSILIFSVALGLAVDNTVHVLRRIQEKRQSLPLQEAVLKALRLTAVPMLRGSAVVGIGFAVLVLSTSKAIALLGVTVLLCAGVALLADLLLVPTGVLLLGERRRRD